MSVDTGRRGAAEQTGAAGRPAASDGRRREGWLSFWGPPLLVFAVFIGGWYFVSLVLLDPDRRFLLPPPDEVISGSFLNATNRTELFQALWLSTWVAMLGLAIAIAVGMALGIIMAQARWIERSLYPYAVILQCIPTLAMVPVLGFWFGFGIGSRLLVCVLIALFPVITSTLFGLQSAEQGQHELFTLHGSGRLTRLWKLQLPTALPALFNGFQVSSTLAVVGAVVGDFFFKQGDAGIGVLIDLYRMRLQTDLMFGAALLASLLGVLVFWFFGALGRFVTSEWYGSTGYDSSS